MRFESESDEAFDQFTQPPSASEEGYVAPRSMGLVTLLDECHDDGNEWM